MKPVERKHIEEVKDEMTGKGLGSGHIGRVYRAYFHNKISNVFLSVFPIRNTIESTLVKNNKIDTCVQCGQALIYHDKVIFSKLLTFLNL